MLPVKGPALRLSHGDDELRCVSGREAAAKAEHAVAVDAGVVVGNAERGFVAQRAEMLPDLPSAVKIIDGEIQKPLRRAAKPVVHREGDAHPASEKRVVLLAEADHDDAVHVPHGSKLHDLLRALGLFHHHKLAAALDLRGEKVQRGGDEKIVERVALVFRMVVDENAEDARAVPGKQDARHAGDILPLLEKRRHALDRFCRDFSRFAVDHVGNGRCAQTQFFRNVADAHALGHKIASCR